MRVFWAAAGGRFIPCVLLQAAAAELVTVPGTVWGPFNSSTDQRAAVLPSLLAALTMLGITVGSISANI